MAKTIAEINEKISKGKAIVATADEIITIAKAKGISRTAKEVDVVTTGTFGPMCSSGVFLNIGHTKPRIKIGGGKAYLNDVPVYTGLAAVDVLLGATALPDDDPKNRFYPGEFNYGGGHVIEDLVAGKDIALVVNAYGTDCYPRKKLETWINISDINNAILFNIRNASQNYEVAVNSSNKIIYTYMGVLKPNFGNANYCTSGQLSPLLNDPDYKTIGIGTKVFLGGGIGYVAWYGTQHNPNVPRTSKRVPLESAGNLSLIGDLKQMKPSWLLGTSILGYGTTLTVGVGIPIPILSEEILEHTLITDAEISAPIIEFSKDYPQLQPNILGEVTYAELRSGNIILQGKNIPTSSLSSYPKAVEIADILKSWIEKGNFTLTEAVAPLPGAESGITFKPLKERPITETQ